MAAFHRGEVTLRKLRVLIEHLPEDNPVHWHHHDGRQWTVRDQLIWRLLWADATTASKDLKKGTNIFEKMPKFPWTESENKMGGWGSRDGNEVLDYLASLE